MFFWVLVLLAGSLRVVALWFMAFAVRLLKRQEYAYRTVLGRLAALQKALEDAVQKSETIRASLTQISIPVNEPINKYESVTLPEDAAIRFVEKK